MNLLVVRPAVSNRGRHRQQPRRGEFTPTFQIDRPSDSAHQADLSNKPRCIRHPQRAEAGDEDPNEPVNYTTLGQSGSSVGLSP